MIANIPPIRPISATATTAQRRQAFRDYCFRMQLENPRHWNFILKKLKKAEEQWAAEDASKNKD